MKDSDWRILVTLYEKKSMTKAAEALFLTQPALTKKVRAMEEEWGIEIVRRSSKGVTFTEEGLYLVKRAIVMMDFIKEIEDHFAAERPARELLKIGVPNSFARLHMPQLFKAYGEKYDHVQFKTVPDSSDRLVRQHGGSTGYGDHLRGLSVPGREGLPVRGADVPDRAGGDRGAGH